MNAARDDVDSEGIIVGRFPDGKHAERLYDLIMHWMEALTPLINADDGQTRPSKDASGIAWRVVE